MRNVVEIDPKYIGWGLPVWTSTLVDVDIVRQLATTNDDLLSLRLFDLVHSAHCAINMNNPISHVIVMDSTSDLDMMMVDPSTKPALGFYTFPISDLRPAQKDIVILAVPPSDVGALDLYKWDDIYKEVLTGGDSLAQETRRQYSRFNEMVRRFGRDIKSTDFPDIAEAQRKMGADAEVVEENIIEFRGPMK